MKENKKVILEQGDKKVTIEQGIEDIISNTPKWDALKVNLKEGTAEKATIFGRAFIEMLVPAFIVCTIITIAFAIILWRC